MSIRLLGPLLVLLTGCPRGVCEPGPDPLLQIGVGIDRFHGVPDGSDVPLVYGAQGGFHIDLALRAAHFDTSDLVSGTLSGTVDGEDVAGGQPWLMLSCEEAGQEALGVRLIFDATPPELDGQVVHVELDLRDIDGHQASDSIDLRIVDLLADDTGP